MNIPVTFMYIFRLISNSANTVLIVVSRVVVLMKFQNVLCNIRNIIQIYFSYGKYSNTFVNHLKHLN